MEIGETDHAVTYRIKIKEELHPGATDWFGGLTVTHGNDGGTLLVGSFPDQPALRGFLEQLWNLNFTVLSVEKIL